MTLEILEQTKDQNCIDLPNRPFYGRQKAHYKHVMIHNVGLTHAFVIMNVLNQYQKHCPSAVLVSAANAER